LMFLASRSRWGSEYALGGTLSRRAQKKWHTKKLVVFTSGLTNL